MTAQELMLKSFPEAKFCSNGSLYSKSPREHRCHWFVIKAEELHGKFYDYSRLYQYFETGNTPVAVVCPLHGSFQTRMTHHVARGSACPRCAGNKKLTPSDFYSRVKTIHKDKYLYYQDYTKINEKIKIKCPLHGDFMQRPLHHLYNGSGCPACGDINKSNNNHYKYLYIFNLGGLYKIGVSNNVPSRLASWNIGKAENWSIVAIYTSEDSAFIKEQELHSTYKEFNFIDKGLGGGYTEVFSLTTPPLVTGMLEVLIG